jgi:hypothetical protein
MAYDLVVNPDAYQHAQKPFPDELRAPLRDAFARIISNPRGVGRPPASPPHAPGGYVHEFHSDLDGGRYYFAIFYEIDEDKEKIGVTRMAIRPPYDFSSTRQPPPPNDNFIELPPTSAPPPHTP